MFDVLHAPPISCEMNSYHVNFPCEYHSPTMQCTTVSLLCESDFPGSVFWKGVYFFIPCDYYSHPYFANQNHTQQRLFFSLSKHSICYLFKTDNKTTTSSKLPIFYRKCFTQFVSNRYCSKFFSHSCCPISPFISARRYE